MGTESAEPPAPITPKIIPIIINAKYPKKSIGYCLVHIAYIECIPCRPFIEK